MLKRFALFLLLLLTIASSVRASTMELPVLTEIVEQYDESSSFESILADLLDGESFRSFRLGGSPDLIVRIEAPYHASLGANVEFIDPISEEEGIWSEFFPLENGQTGGYLAYLQATENYRGTDYLEALDVFAQIMRVSFVYLEDGAVVTDPEIVDGVQHQMFLRLYRILATDSPLGWYESKGYRPVDEEMVEAWREWEISLESSYDIPSPVEYEEAKDVVREITLADLMEIIPLFKRLELDYTEAHVAVLQELSAYGADRPLWELLRDVRENDRSLFYRATRYLVHLEDSPLADLFLHFLSQPGTDQEFRVFMAGGLLSIVQSVVGLEDGLDALLLQKLTGQNLDSACLEEYAGVNWMEGARERTENDGHSTDPAELGAYKSEIGLDGDFCFPSLTLDHLLVAAEIVKNQATESLWEGGDTQTLEEYLRGMSWDEQLEWIQDEESPLYDAFAHSASFMHGSSTGDLEGAEKYLQFQLGKLVIMSQHLFLREF